MADPPITAPPDAEAPVAKQGASPRFFRDGRRDAFFEDEAGSEPSKRRKNGKPEDRSFHYDESTSRQKPPPPSVVVGKLHLLKYPKDEVLVDFNPLENLAYSGAKLVNADEDTKVESYQDMGGDDAGAATTKVNGDDDDWRIAAKEQDKPSPNCVSGRKQDPGSLKLNDPKFGRRRFATWIDLAINEEFGGQEWSPYYIHKPESFSADEAKIPLLFGVGGDLTRHGVRHFFEQSTDTILINVAGTEGYMRKRVIRGGFFKRKRWGVGITRAQIEELLSLAGVTVPWSISTLVAFSTGFRGLHATIMNTLTTDQETVQYDPAAGDPSESHPDAPPATPQDVKRVPGGTGLASALAKVSRVAIYDCLYRDDKPKVGQPNSLADVLNHLALLAPHTADSQLQLLVYDVTSAGSSRNLRPFDARIDDLKLADDVRAQYALDLRSLRQKPENPDSPTRIEWLAIITCRLLKEALADEMIDPDAFDTTLDQARYKPSKELIHALIDRLGEPAWERGNVSSSESPPAGKTSYATFFADDDERKRFANVMGMLHTDFVQRYQLLGWGAWNLGEVAHDGLLVEFGWEALL